MNIIEQNDSKLTLKISPSLWFSVIAGTVFTLSGLLVLFFALFEARGLIGYIAGSFFILIGIAIMLNLLRSDTFTFDKMMRRLIWTRQGIINSKTQEHGLDHIQDVYIKRISYRDPSLLPAGNKETGVHYRIYLIMPNDKKIHLNFFAPTRNKNEAEKIAWLITAAIEGADAGPTATSNTIEDSLDLSVLKKQTTRQPTLSYASKQRSKLDSISKVLNIIIAIPVILFMLAVPLVAGYLILNPDAGQSSETSSNSTSTLSGYNFELWELHPDDTVRIVDVITKENAVGSEGWTDLLWLRKGDQILSLDFIGSKMVDTVKGEENYRGTTYITTRYQLDVTDNKYGHNIRVSRPPHLHINGSECLISIGVDPHPQPKTIAVAIPTDAAINDVYDLQPYKQTMLDQWNIFYYNTVDIQSHESIHIKYTPGGDASPLDWENVEAAR